MSTVKSNRRQRIRWNIRKKVSGTATMPRLAVYRSNKGIYAQLIDDVNGVTLASSSTQELGLKSLNMENAKKVGEGLAKKATENGIAAVVFDRGGYLYHGNVKALADAARQGGLKF